MKESKSLYSSDISSAVEGDTGLTGLKNEISSENFVISGNSDDLSWCYIYVHNSRLEKVKTQLEKRFNTFIHKTVYYSKKDGHVQTNEKPTIPGLMFIQGKKHDIQLFLNEKLSGLHLATDRATQKVAVIRNDDMQSFIRLSAFENRRIRVLEKPIEYYADGSIRVRVITGILKGTEGYIVRISREKRLVTKFGNITVAISGIIKESMEEIGV